jgi:hypothetical protein
MTLSRLEKDAMRLARTRTADRKAKDVQDLLDYLRRPAGLIEQGILVGDGGKETQQQLFD